MSQEATSYLGELQTALRGLPIDLRREIFEAVREELAGLDSTATRARIEDLGDPKFIASEAAAGVARPLGPETAATISPAYVVVTGLFVAVGGIILPVAGWIVGLVLLWTSNVWSRWQKLVATLLPPVAALVAVAVFIALQFAIAPPPVNALPLVAASAACATLGTGMWILARGLKAVRARP